MNYLLYARNENDIQISERIKANEVIIEPRELSRFGKLYEKDAFELIRLAKTKGLQVWLEWDILMSEQDFKIKVEKLTPYLDKIDGLRVQDPGALHWCFNQTTLPLIFIAENGNHNLVGLKSWKDTYAPRLKRISLSIELPKDIVKKYITELGIDVELLGLGRILLFYTPRNLLSPLMREKKMMNEIEALGESEESPHKGFPIIENSHGTFMFHIKDFCILDYHKELKEYGLKTLRLDLRWQTQEVLDQLVTMLEAEFDLEQFKNIYPDDLMKGFFNVNKTDVLFPKLKNSRLQKREGDYVGEVIESVKSSHLAIFLKNKNGLKIGDSLKILHPKGEEFFAKVFWIKKITGEEASSGNKDEVILIPYINGVWVKSQVFIQNEDNT